MEHERDTGSLARPDIVCLEGNGYRESHKGDGYIVGGAMYTLNSVEVHAVCYGIDLQGVKRPDSLHLEAVTPPRERERE